MNISNNKRYIETEARIHLAFEKLLSVKSFNEITVNNICNEAGISRPSFYAHYEDINDMMIFLMAGLKSIAYNWLTDGCKTSSHTLAQIAFKQYQSLLDC